MSERPITRETVLAALCAHIGAERAIHGAQLAAVIADVACARPDQQRSLRRTIQILRGEGHHICGHPAAGYYLAADAKELDRTCEWLYSRAMTTLVQVAAMKRVSLPDLRGQLRLPS